MADETVAQAPGSSDPKIAFAEFKLHLAEITPRVYVVPAVVALNVLVFGIMVASGVNALHPTTEDALRWGADYGPLTLGGQPWRMLTNVFVHFGVMHLVANMVALLNAGAIIERLFGSLAFAALYLVAGITGSIASLAVHPFVVSAGASGAIFGVYGALGALVLLQRGLIPKVALSKLGGVAGTFIAYNIIYGVGHAGIDNLAHLGGLFGGAVAGALLFRPLIPGRSHEARRPALLVAVACALGLLVTLVLPRPLDLGMIIKNFEAGENATIADYNATLDELNTNRISAQEVAKRLEQTILPEWRRTGAAFEEQVQSWKGRQTPSDLQKKLVALLERTISSRQSGWMRMIAALRANDRPSVIQSSNEMETTMKDILEQIRSLNPS